MALAESPHSVIVRPTPNPDTTTLTRGESGVRVIEPKGQNVKKAEQPVDRDLILKHEGDVSVAFRTSPDLDLVAFQRADSSVTQYVARNGVYIEFGAVNSIGERSGAQYSLRDGSMLNLEVSPTAFEQFEVPTEIGTLAIGIIKNICTELREDRKTPSPMKLGVLEGFISQAVVAKPTNPSL